MLIKDMKGWKYNTIVYQREGWLSDFPKMSIGENDEIEVRFLSRRILPGWNMHMVEGEECFALRLRSGDMGLTWELASKEPVIRDMAQDPSAETFRDDAVRLPDGTLVYLESHWMTAPADRAEEIEKETPILLNAGPGIVGYISRLYCHRSTDGGKTWETREPEEIGPYYTLGCWGGGTGSGWFTLEDGTVMGTMVGKQSSDEEKNHVYILSSRDGGRRWNITPVPYTGPYRHAECGMIRLRGSGRILLAARNMVDGVNIQVAWSDDNGKTWEPFHPTPMRGYPPHLLELKSGKVLCTYGRRFRPFGIRACLSQDGGETWDVENEIVLEDNGTERYRGAGGLGYPISAQLSDGSIVTAYYNQKPTEVEGEYVAKGWQPKPDMEYASCSVAYIGLARFTEGYVRPVGLEPGDVTILPPVRKETAPDQEEIYRETDM